MIIYPQKDTLTFKIFVFCVIWFLLGGVVLFAVNRYSSSISAPCFATHFYKEKDRDLTNVKLKVFYFIPENRQDKIYKDWRADFEETLKEMKSFHEAQFSSKFEYFVFPVPIIGSKDNFFYDGARTDGGNPNAIGTVAGEIRTRALISGGDLYNEDFVRYKSGGYEVLAFVYEGVGAIGSSEGRVLLSRGYLTSEKVKKYGASIFYHEIMHAFGVPDFYDKRVSEDIMGEGRFNPLKETFVAENVKEEMTCY